MGDNKSNSQSFGLPDYGYKYYASTSENSNWINYNPYGDIDSPYTVRVTVDLDKIKNDKNYEIKKLDIPNHPEYEEVRIYSNVTDRIPSKYIKSTDIIRRKSGDPDMGWSWMGILPLEPEVKKYIDRAFKNDSDLDYDEMFSYFTDFYNEEFEYDDVSQEVQEYIDSKTM